MENLDFTKKLFVAKNSISSILVQIKTEKGKPGTPSGIKPPTTPTTPTTQTVTAPAPANITEIIKPEIKATTEEDKPKSTEQSSNEESSVLSDVSPVEKQKDTTEISDSSITPAKESLFVPETNTEPIENLTVDETSDAPEEQNLQSEAQNETNNNLKIISTSIDKILKTVEEIKTLRDAATSNQEQTTNQEQQAQNAEQIQQAAEESEKIKSDEVAQQQLLEADANKKLMIDDNLGLANTDVKPDSNSINDLLNPPDEKDQQKNEQLEELKKIQEKQTIIFNKILKYVKDIQKGLESDRYAEAERQKELLKEKEALKLDNENIGKKLPGVPGGGDAKDSDEGGLFDSLLDMVGLRDIKSLVKGGGNLLSKGGQMLSRGGSAIMGGLSSAGSAISGAGSSLLSTATGGLGVAGLMNAPAAAALSGSLGVGAAATSGAAVVGTAVAGFYAGDAIAEKTGVGIYGWAKDSEKQAEQAEEAAKKEPDELRRLQKELMALNSKADAEKMKSLGGIGGWFRSEGVATEETLQAIQDKRKEIADLMKQRGMDQKKIEQPTNQPQPTSTSEQTAATTTRLPPGAENIISDQSMDVVGDQTLPQPRELKQETKGNVVEISSTAQPDQTITDVSPQPARTTTEQQAASAVSINQAIKLAKMESDYTPEPSTNIRQTSIDNSTKSFISGSNFYRNQQPETMRRST